MHSVIPPDPKEWRMLVQAAVLELDLVKIPQRIRVAHAAVMNEMENGPHSGVGVEHWVLVDALNTLRDLRIMTEEKVMKRDQDAGEG